ncbi:ABC transporter permease [Clostridium estertheticum]|uniref:ABC transporter permease n=1 Tax=Clostridium estertheticum subsp. estertheticum TaxID=1552 RepID=A0A1J0GHP2_9CLOT|nr:ABC transporter permease [Clostridium estertheticum]APC40843.1 hypothetical protein A7L45_12575 [Clostridium estertheticum subsp. estertheticum]MBZ9617300.1 ABC transporter permease [Clostridium estertheticum subsp. laramiense]WAG72989.1 ABC transporter permease [Clostridium estertheticum]
MLNLIKCELIKIKNLKPIILSFIVPLLMSIVGLINIYRGLVETTDLWDAVYNQTFLLYASLTLPLAITIIISIQWRLEYKKNNILNLCSSSIKLNKIYLSKIMTTLLIIFLNIIILIISVLIFSNILIPKESFRYYVIYAPIIAFLYSIPLVCLQHLISMYNRNFIGSVSVGIILSFIGFLLSHTSLGILIPNTYIVCGSFIGVSSYPIATDMMATITFPYINLLILVVPILSIILYLLGNYLFSKKEF